MNKLERGGTLKCDLVFRYGMIPAGTSVEVPMTDEEGIGNIVVEEQGLVLFVTNLKVDEYVTFDNDEDEGVQECPVCHASCRNDQTIDDHGMCIDCFHDRESSDVRLCVVCGSERVIDGLKAGTVYCLNCGFQAEPILENGEDEHHG